MTGIRLDHVQITIPQGSEEEAQSFYGDVPGLLEVAKPDKLAGRGRLWFVLVDGVGLHLGVDPKFSAATRAHPGLIVDDLGAFKNWLWGRESEQHWVPIPWVANGSMSTTSLAIVSS